MSRASGSVVVRIDDSPAPIHRTPVRVDKFVDDFVDKPPSRGGRGGLRYGSIANRAASGRDGNSVDGPHGTPGPTCFVGGRVTARFGLRGNRGLEDRPSMDRTTVGERAIAVAT